MITLDTRQPTAADQTRDPRTNTCAVTKTCTVRAAGVARIAHTIVWACPRHRDDELSETLALLPPALKTLDWEDAGNNEPGDQNADSALTEPGCTSMYWSLGPGMGAGMWTVELIGVNEGDEVPTAGIRLSACTSEQAAKDAAEEYENGVRR